MPTVLYIDGFRVMVLTQDHPPAHVHVSKAGKRAKIDLQSLEIDESTMSQRDQSKALAIVQLHQAVLWEVWRHIHG